MILDYSLCGPGILDIDTQFNFLELKWISGKTHQYSPDSLKTYFLTPALLVEV